MLVFASLFHLPMNNSWTKFISNVNLWWNFFKKLFLIFFLLCLVDWNRCETAMNIYGMWSLLVQTLSCVANFLSWIIEWIMFVWQSTIDSIWSIREAQKARDLAFRSSDWHRKCTHLADFKHASIDSDRRILLGTLEVSRAPNKSLWLKQKFLPAHSSK